MPTPDPIAFSVFGIDIMWYAVPVSYTHLDVYKRQVYVY